MATLLDGRRLATSIEQRLAEVVAQARARHPELPPPGLAVLRVGDDPASAVYVANKEKEIGRAHV